MNIQKWQLISKTDVSPSKWFPIENRVYQMPGGKVIDDFTVTTLPDVSMIIPVTKDNKVVLVRQYKPGVDEIMIQLPAGRIEPNHQNFDECAQHELEEETGIKVEISQLHQFAKLSGFSTKATEVVYAYLATECEFNSQQNFDPTEEIEVLTVSFDDVDNMILSGEIWCSQAIACWELAKKKFPEIFISEKK